MTITMVYKGDGRTKENAVTFEGVTNRAKQIVLQYLWLAKNNYETRQQVVRECPDGAVYELHFTDRGPVWFKF